MTAAWGLMFPDDDMLGVDIVINDFSYLRDRVTMRRYGSSGGEGTIRESGAGERPFLSCKR